MHILDIEIYFPISNRTVYYGVSLANEDVRTSRLNSQIDPATVTSPVGEQIAKGTFKLSPTGVYNGTVTFLRKPKDIVFGYTVISGRVIVYDPNTSVQFEWNDQWQNAVLVKALSSIGINLTDQQVSQYAELKTSSNYQSVNMV